MDEPNHLACREYDQLLSPTNDAPGQRKIGIEKYVNSHA